MQSSESDAIVERALVPTCRRAFQLGYGERRITFHAQQVRACNLAYALLQADRMHPGDKVGVVGAGIAGLTFAAACRRLCVDVRLFDKASNVLSLQRGSRRVLHPHIYEWPAPDTRARRTHLPVLNWRADEARKVIARLEDEWKESTSDTQASLEAPARLVGFEETAEDVTLEFARAEARERVSGLAFAIFALGYGEDRVADGNGGRPYWRDDDLHQELPVGHRLLVVGNGDGGLVDCLRVALSDFDHARFAEDLLDLPGMDDVGVQVGAIEADVERLLEESATDGNELANLASTKLAEAYERIDLPDALAEWLEQRRKQRLTHVVLQGRTPTPFNFGAAPLHRLVVHALFRGERASPSRSLIYRCVPEGAHDDGGAFDRIVMRGGRVDDPFQAVAGLAGKLVQPPKALRAIRPPKRVFPIDFCGRPAPLVAILVHDLDRDRVAELRRALELEFPSSVTDDWKTLSFGEVSAVHAPAPPDLAITIVGSRREQVDGLWRPERAPRSIVAVSTERHDWRKLDSLRNAPGCNLAERAEIGRLVGVAFEDVERTLAQARRGETTVGPRKPYDKNFRLARLNLIGRKRERERLVSWLDESAGPTLCVVRNEGGIGKSALVRDLIAELGGRAQTRFPWIFCWSFYSQGTSDARVSASTFVPEALRWFRDPRPELGSQEEKGRRLADLVAASGSLLVLDGLEPLQFGYATTTKAQTASATRDRTGECKDATIQALLERLATHGGRGRCLVTTRVELRLPHVDATRYVDVELLPLSLAESVQLLETLGALGTRSALERVAKACKGHPLTLSLLASYVKQAHDGKVSGIIGAGSLCAQLDRHDARTRPKGGRSRSVMSAYVDWFGPDSVHVGVLSLLGLFDRPAALTAIDEILRRRQQLGLAVLPASTAAPAWLEALDHLRKLRLISSAESASDDVVDAHPLVREYFGDRWKRDKLATWQAAHACLSDHYSHSVVDLPHSPMEIEQLYAAVHHGCEARRHQPTFDDIHAARIWRADEEYYATRKLGLIGSDLAALARYCATRDGTPDFTEPLRHLATETRIRVVLNAGYRLRALGRLAEARRCFSAVRELGNELPTPSRRSSLDIAAAGAESCELETLCADLRDVLQIGDTAIKKADESGDAFFEVHARLGLAEALFHLDRRNEALELVDEAKRRHEEARASASPPRHPFLYSQACYRCCLLWLAEPNGHGRVFREASAVTDWGTRPDGSLLSRALDKLCDAHAKFEELKDEPTTPTSVRIRIDDAVADLERAGYVDYLVRGRILRAHILISARNVGGAELELAESDLEDARIDSDGMSLLQVQVRLELARLKHAQGSTQAARDWIESAESLRRRIGYERIRREVEDMARQLDATA